MKKLIALLLLSSGLALAAYEPQTIITDASSGRTATVTVLNALTVDGSGSVQPVSGTFWQTTQPVSQSGTFTTGRTWTLSSGTDSVNVGNFPSTYAVTGTFWQATQPVSLSTLPSLVAGTAIIGKTGIDQTTPGTTNKVYIGTDGVVTITGTVPIPTGAATASNQVTGNASLSSIDGKITAVNTGAVVVASSALPSGAATVAKQPALGTAGSASSDVLTVQGITSMTALKTDGSGVTQPVSGTVTANAGTGTFTVDASGHTVPVSGTFWQATQPVSIASLPALTTGSAIIGRVGIDQTTPGTTNLVSIGTTGTVQTKAPLTASGSGSSAGATVSTVSTLTAPSNCIGFILMNLDTSTANIRWAVGRTASTTLGQQLQPGRDTGFVPIGANVSVIAESGTQNYDIQWLAQ